MDSLKVGKEIYSLLNGNDSLTGVVGSKIYPIIVEKETTYPFIVYKRSNIIPDYTKDFSFVLKQKKETKKNSRLTFFSYSHPSLR